MSVMLDSLKHRNVREKLQSSIPPPALSEGDDPLEALQFTMLEDELRRILEEKLTEKCRMVFLLSRIEGKSNQEIADLLGLSVRTVENHINHALKILTKKLSRRR